MGVSPYNILSLYLRLLIRMEWECVMLSWVPWRRSTSMRRVRRTTVTATERCYYHPISCQQNYETLFFTDNIQCVIWSGPHSNWLETGDRERQSRGEKVQIHKYIKPRNSIYRNYKVAALEATMCSTVPLEDLYKRRWSVFNVFQYISVVSAIFQWFTEGCGGTRGWLPWPSWRGTWRGRRPPATSWPAARNHASMKLLEWRNDSNSLRSDLKKDDGMNWLDGINIMSHITKTAAAKMKTFGTFIFGKQWDSRFGADLGPLILEIVQSSFSSEPVPGF